jgi:hypothetical protein
MLAVRAQDAGRLGDVLPASSLHPASTPRSGPDKGSGTRALTGQERSSCLLRWSANGHRELSGLVSVPGTAEGRQASDAGPLRMSRRPAVDENDFFELELV